MARGAHDEPASLPTVSFSKVDDGYDAPGGVQDVQSRSYGYNDFSVFKPTDSYMRFIEPLESELAVQVEYDMDEQDQEWLDLINTERKNSQISTVSPETFEIIMDRLEKEWFDLTKNIPKPDMAMPSEDSTCAICDDSEGENSNAIVFCDGCNLAVHQDCYGVPYIPEGQWLCRKCTVSPEVPVSCLLCPNEGGAFKQTEASKWVHLLCAIWVPETHVTNETFMEPVAGVDKIPKNRWKLKCKSCEVAHGACIQCAKSSCFTAYHPTCARREKLLMPMKAREGAEPGALTCFCDKHLPQEQYEIRQAALIKEQQEGGAEDGKLSKSARAYAKTYKPGPPLVPALIVDRILNYTSKIKKPRLAEFVYSVCKYWSQKREARRGAPLLKRLHLEPWTASTAGKLQTDEEKKMKLEHLQKLREDFEGFRNIAVMVREREEVKLEQMHAISNVMSRMLYPHEKSLGFAFEKIMSMDRQHYLRDPVSRIEVPDYYEVISRPMCWRDIEVKMEKHQYWDLQSFKDDINLVIDNALRYNKNYSPIHKVATKLKLAAEPILTALDKHINTPAMSLEVPDDAPESLFPETGDLEPPVSILQLLLTSGAIQDDYEHLLEDQPVESLLKFELGIVKPPPKEPTPILEDVPEPELPREASRAPEEVPEPLVKGGNVAVEPSAVAIEDVPVVVIEEPTIPTLEEPPAPDVETESIAEQKPEGDDSSDVMVVDEPIVLDEIVPSAPKAEPPHDDTPVTEEPEEDVADPIVEDETTPATRKAPRKKARKAKRVRDPAAERKRAADNRAAAAAAAVAELEPLVEEPVEQVEETVEQVEVRAPRRTRHSAAAEAAFVGGDLALDGAPTVAPSSLLPTPTRKRKRGTTAEVEGPVDEEPQDVSSSRQASPETSEAGGNKKRRRGPRPSRASVFTEAAFVDDVDSQGSFTMFEQGWILPEGQKRGVTRRTPTDTPPPPSKRVKSTAKSKLSVVETAPEKENSPLTENEMDVDPTPTASKGKKRAIPSSRESSASPPPLTLIPGVHTIVHEADGSVVVEQVETPALRREMALKRKLKREEAARATQAVVDEDALSDLTGISSDGEEKEATLAPAPSKDVDDEVAGPPTVSRRGKKAVVDDLGSIEWKPGQTLEGGTLVWAKSGAYPWWPAIVFQWENNAGEIPKSVLEAGVKARRSRKRVKGQDDLQLVRFYDKAKSWQWCIPDKLRLFGEVDELDADLIAVNSVRQRWANNQRKECLDAFRLARSEQEDAVEEEDEDEEPEEAVVKAPKPAPRRRKSTAGPSRPRKAAPKVAAKETSAGPSKGKGRGRGWKAQEQEFDDDEIFNPPSPPAPATPPEPEELIPLAEDAVGDDWVW